MNYEAIVIGASAGGMKAIQAVLEPLGDNFAASIVIVLHMSPKSDNFICKFLNESCGLIVKEAEEKEKIEGGRVYISPPNYHLLIERDRTISFTVEEKVSYSRPSIDVLFESAAEAYGSRLIGLILTGGNSDGSKGLKKIKELGGITIVQNPFTAEANLMPGSAINTVDVDYILDLEKIGYKLFELAGEYGETDR